MFSRKLKAVGYHHPEDFNAEDETEFRTFIVWLEDQKIRLYKIEDRAPLRDTSSKDWERTFEKYLDDLCCPVSKSNRVHVISWLLSHVVRLEFAESPDAFRKKHQEREQRKASTKEAIGQEDSSSLSAVTSENPDLKAGIASLSNLLALPHHHDHVIILQAIQKLIHERLTEEAINEARKSGNGKKKPREGDYVPIAEVNLGFDTNDSAINEAAKILRLLHLRELRDLQTYINKAIVSVQTVTANPKTDESLGRVGR